jgi:hypothetical protein
LLGTEPDPSPDGEAGEAGEAVQVVERGGAFSLAKDRYLLLDKHFLREHGGGADRQTARDDGEAAR